MQPPERQPRIATRLLVVETEGGSAAYYTKNLSMGGLFVLADKRWAVGSEIELTLTIGTLRLEFTARVTHLQRDGVGMCFINPSDEVREALRHVIASEIPRAGSGPVEALSRVVGLGGSKGPRLAWTDGKNRHESLARDIDIRGAFFEADVIPDVGSTIIVYVPAMMQNDDEEIEHELRGCTGEVVSHGRGGFEVRFSTPSAEFRMAMDHLLRDA